jgi:hypothetical protein
MQVLLTPFSHHQGCHTSVASSSANRSFQTPHEEPDLYLVMQIFRQKSPTRHAQMLMPSSSMLYVG